MCEIQFAEIPLFCAHLGWSFVVYILMRRVVNRSFSLVFRPCLSPNIRFSSPGARQAASLFCASAALRVVRAHLLVRYSTPLHPARLRAWHASQAQFRTGTTPAASRAPRDKSAVCYPAWLVLVVAAAVLCVYPVRRGRYQMLLRGRAKRVCLARSRRWREV